MRKEFIKSVVTILMGSCLLAGCGVSATCEVEEDDIGEKLHQALEVAEKEELCETEVDGNAGIIVEENVEIQDVVDPELNMDMMAEKNSLTIEILNEVEQKLDPVAIAAEEKWTDALKISSEWKADIETINVKIAEKTSVKLTDINLEDGTVSYLVTSPDVIGYLTDNISDNETLSTICKKIADSMEEDKFPYKEQILMLPIEVNGTDFNVNFESEEVMGTITGGFYNMLMYIQ